MSVRLERAKAGWTRPANSIQASGHVNGRINRPDTRQHLTRRAHTLKNPLASMGASTHGHNEVRSWGRPRCPLRPKAETADTRPRFRATGLDVCLPLAPASADL